MQFQTPQFIDIEDKLFGPLTFKQFVYIGGGLGLAFSIYYFIPFKIISIPIAFIFAVVGLLLAFYSINNRPLVFMIQYAFNYFTNSRLYIWKKIGKKPEHTNIGSGANKSGLYVPKLSDSKLKDLSWSLNIKESLNPTPREEKPLGRIIGGYKL
jgi:cellulose synthase/poly-beta-1,6-N-acetylglucosamine synthase-like glycosyltransferase